MLDGDDCVDDCGANNFDDDSFDDDSFDDDDVGNGGDSIDEG